MSQLTFIIAYFCGYSFIFAHWWIGYCLIAALHCLIRVRMLISYEKLKSEQISRRCHFQTHSNKSPDKADMLECACFYC